MAENGTEDINKLDLIRTIGFNGNIPGGLKVHPNRQHVVYALGNTVIVEDITSHQQCFLSGHTNDVSCLTVSKSGNYLASGQVTHMGFKADVIIWDFEKRELYARLTLHKVKVESLAFSPKDKYLVTVGGQDDGSVVVWNIAKKEAICGSPAAVPSDGTTMCVTYANMCDETFITGGNGTLRKWKLDLSNRKIRPTDVRMGQLKRIVKCIEIDEADEFIYCGTTSGDILKVGVNTCIMAEYGPVKEKFSLGIMAIGLLKSEEIIVGAGDGTVALVRKTLKRKKISKVTGGVTSIALRGLGHQFFVGTSLAELYQCNLGEFTFDLVKTCHYSDVLDVTFPAGASQLFATCSKNDIRIWSTTTGAERLRITVPNLTCNGIDIMENGSSIVSAWDDGKIRAFYPESGKLMYVIHDAHNKGVTALATTSDCRRIVSGGSEGQLRIWDIHEKEQKLVTAMKEHKGKVACIRLRKTVAECVSASEDGTCIIWDLQNFLRKQVIFANTLFKCVCYHPEEFQIVTSGSDRKIGYWETFDGSQIRELDGAQSGAINGMDISSNGKNFVTGGDDKIIKLWGYNEGAVTHVGMGHSGSITRVKICPCLNYIVSVSADGAILIWRYPD
ncbi:cilia- and flagella-associated protein 52-like [Saccoglossus kowalevskii]|uniref:Cilia- and flagella-associated protein 52 n=1 Tax=Saccoglossus kowalevskii TaxID=10224 RepID=A0ABM0GT13_SACKO|nr:PREDICTED: WD repeat-containing protein 16-like [Saccoglossus kowalevskii]